MTAISDCRRCSAATSQAAPRPNDQLHRDRPVPPFVCSAEDDWSQPKNAIDENQNTTLPWVLGSAEKWSKTSSIMSRIGE